MPRRWPADHLAAAMRAAAGRDVRREAETLRAAGTEVLLLQPGAEELALMGLNLMRKEGRRELAELAAHNVLRDLRTDAAAPARALLGLRPASRRSPAGRRRAAARPAA